MDISLKRFQTGFLKGITARFFLSLIFVSGLGVPAFAHSLSVLGEVIYGMDNRYDAINYPVRKTQILSRSTAAMMSPGVLKSESPHSSWLKVEAPSLREALRLCHNDRFGMQPIGAQCSGFLIAPDLLVTAGHCVTSEAECRSNRWVFDYVAKSQFQSDVYVRRENVFRCKRIVSHELNPLSKVDYAVVQLDRPAHGRIPLLIRTQGSVQYGDRLVVMGYPSGLPLKIADDAMVTENFGGKRTYFQANLDTFGGNSGSVVLNARTGIVEGILVRGEHDYSYNAELGCNTPKLCNSFTGQCRGEDVTRITEIFRRSP